MPALNAGLHLRMLSKFKRRNMPLRRLFRSLKRDIFSRNVYGLEWGDPEVVEPLQFIRDRFVLPYVNAAQHAVEIGPGGGRWTRYLLGFKKLSVIDYHGDVLDELKKNFNKSNMEFIKNNGADFPGIGECSIDYLFSFDVFVHFEVDVIEAYFKNMRSILKPGANVVIHYSDKTKIMARENKSFSDNTPEKMRAMTLGAGYQILEEDLTTMWHSSIIRYTV